MVAFLQQSEGSEGFHQILDFLNASHIKFALTKNPIIYVSFIKQFWSTATASTDANGQMELTASIDGHVKTIIEASLRRHLKLEDNDGVTSLPNSEIFEQLALMGALSTSQPQHSQPSPDAEEAIPTPHESPLQSIHSLGRVEGSQSLQELLVLCTTLSKKVEENELKSGKAKRRARIVLLEEEDAAKDSSKQGRKISDIDEDPNVSLVQDEGMTWSQDVEIQEKVSDDTVLVVQEDEPTELVEDQGSGEKGEKEVTTPVNYQTYIRRRRGVSTGSGEDSTANIQVSTVDVSTASEITTKDKGKAIMIEPEHEKKSKKQQEQDRLRLEEAIRLQEQLDEQERQMLSRDAEIAQRLQEEINVVVAQETSAQTKQSKEKEQDIDWSNPSVIRYHALQLRPRPVAEVRKNMCIYLKNQGGYTMKDFKGMSYDDIMPIFEKVWDQINTFVPMDSELEVQRLKRKGQDDKAEPLKRQRIEEIPELVQ
ncbi:hypothetical protein Tco_1194605 [Tanacetum coccineum]